MLMIITTCKNERLNHNADFLLLTDATEIFSISALFFVQVANNLTNYILSYVHFIIIIVIIIIKKGRQCMAGRERFAPYQSKDPSPTITTNIKKEEKGMTVEAAYHS